MSHLKDKLNKTLEKCKDNIKSAMNQRRSYDVTNRKQSGPSGSHSRFWKRGEEISLPELTSEKRNQPPNETNQRMFSSNTEMERCGLASHRYFQDFTERTQHSLNNENSSNRKKSRKYSFDFAHSGLPDPNQSNSWKKIDGSPLSYLNEILISETNRETKHQAVTFSLNTSQLENYTSRNVDTENTSVNSLKKTIKRPRVSQMSNSILGFKKMIVVFNKNTTAEENTFVNLNKSRCSRRHSVNLVPTILSNSVKSCCARKNMILSMKLSLYGSPKKSKNLEILKSDEILDEIWVLILKMRQEK
ncbi:hypothetical protein HELRODRAFT_178127 [Helobdella robusta]|uniref:Uncharacterized protein n=1 Tax=Helobdella robusta TaxID=6412 RepID=T1FCS7_HELRO|nr:hypothetical protein HELRODRAFT_178127 [Helobdella robusta]ESN97341.1 hypothetical protein HELRODRAFT_178127 [Helobdella robusta]